MSFKDLGFVEVYGGRTSKNFFECSLCVLEAEFLQTFDVKIGVENERGCPLFIVVSEDKLHFELIFLKICSRL